MKQKVFIYLLSISFVISILASCDDDDKKSDFEKKEDLAELPSEGSPESAEEQKDVIEDVGISLNSHLTDAMKSEDMKKCGSFAHFLSYMDESTLESKYNTFKKTKPFSVIQEAAKVQNGEKKMTEYLTDLKKMTMEPESLQEIYDSLSGKYTWNNSEQNWNYTENNEIIFEFPSTIEGTSNDASFVIENVSETELEDYYYFGDNSWFEDSDNAYTGFVPTGLNFYLKVGDSNIMEFEYSASFNGQGAPEQITVDYLIGPLSYMTEFTNSNSKEIYTSTTLKNGDQILLDVGAGVNGNFNQNDVNNSIQYYAYDPETDRDTLISAEDTSDYEYYWPEVDPTKLFKNGFAYMSILDKIKIGGTAQIKDLLAADEEIYPLNYWDNPDFDEEQATEDWANALNSNTDLYMANMEENTWMAQVDFYKKVETDDYYDDTYYYLGMRLKFSDGTKIDPDTYFGEGFDNLIEEFNNSLDDVESAYSGYNY